jgi:GTP-binding protein LepA
MTQDKIRNFCIIAHIDHGKSTLADRFLELTHTVSKRDMHEQMLDTMELEQERGITIKLQPAKMQYKGFDLNLIDTPGHVDFFYEVSRSLAAVEGAILVVDASQGIEAQTLSNVYQAIDHNLEIIPVVNKIDLPHAEPEKVAKEIADLLGIDDKEVIFASGKTGEGVEKILDRIIEKVPAPIGNPEKPLRALIFDSFYDSYKGVVTYVRIVDGKLPTGNRIHLMATKVNAETLDIGIMTPKLVSQKELACGEIGYIVTGLKNVAQAQVGDTVTLLNQEVEALPGYQKVKPFVFAGIYTTEGDDYPLLRDALGKLSLSDSSLEYLPESSTALGFGFRCGFLGLLHMEIIKERLEREFNLDLIVTTPSVSYEVVKASGEMVTLHSASELPDRSQIKEIREPWIKLEIVSPSDYIGPIMELLQKRRGVFHGIDYLEETRVVIKSDLPLSQIVTDFYDQLKSMTSGYASMNYDFIGYKPSDLVRVDILVSEVPVDTLAMLVHKTEALNSGKKIIERLKELIPRQMFKVVLQAAIGGKIIAREDIPAFRKDVTAKLYGGDVTRKNKLREKQKEGKKKMKHLGKVEIPSSVFMELLKKN